MNYQPDPKRYSHGNLYRRCGCSGIRLPALSLGLWHNFGDNVPLSRQRALLRRAFDLGITHFDLANNYGPPAGSAERNFGRILREDFRPWRDELIISTKAGYHMWDGPYGDNGSRKYLLASLDQSLSRMGLEYVDIFYSHRPDPDTPLEETMGALAQAVHSGKALYVGLSSYSPEMTREAVSCLRQAGVGCLIHQPRYNLFDRQVENGLLETLEEEGIGCIPFCPLAQGLLTSRYLEGIPADSRAADPDSPFLQADQINKEKIACIRALQQIAVRRGQSLAQMALAWLLRSPVVTSVLIGASKVSQLEENLRSIEAPPFTPEELAEIDAVLPAKP